MKQWQVSIAHLPEFFSHRGEIDHKGIAHGFNDAAVMVGYGLLDDLVMQGQHLQRASFVVAHLMAEAGDVGEHDGSEFTRLGCCL